MTDTTTSAARFAADGFLVLHPEQVFTPTDLSELERLASAALPAWADGSVNPLENDSHADPRFDYAIDREDGVQLRGVALRHRFLRGHGSLDSALDDNFLFGKRAALEIRRWPDPLISFAENSRLRGHVAGVLGCSELALHDGAIAAVYPGCAGEARQYHIDTPSFMQSPSDPLPSTAVLMTAVVYLSDVDSASAPLRLIPGSHARYQEINESAARSLRRSPERNNVLPGGHTWEEMLPAGLPTPRTIIGRKGTVVFLHGNLLHAWAENATESTTRTMLLHFSCASHASAFTRRPLDRASSARAYRAFSDKALVARTIGTEARLLSRKRVIKHRDSVTEFFKDGWKEPIRPYYYRLQKKLRRVRDKPVESKRFLNVGAGVAWRHPEVICLDHELPNSEVALDLNYPVPLPFEDARFEGVYTSHCMEHLKESQVVWWIREVLRTLRPGGVFRVTAPDIKAYLDAYDARDASYFDWIRGRAAYHYDGWLRLIVRMFAEPVVDNYSDEELKRLYETMPRAEFLEFFNAQVEKVEDERYLNPSCHKSWWSGEKFRDCMLEAGFSSAALTSRTGSACAVFRENAFNRTRTHMSFYVEGTK